MLIKLGLLILLVIHGTSAVQHSSSLEHNGEGNGEHGSNEGENDGAQNHMPEITPASDTTSQTTEGTSPSTKTTSMPSTSTAFEIPAHFSLNYVSTFRKWLRSFAGDLYLQILATTPKDENIFFSPYSIAHSLAVINSGAKGNSSSQIRKTMRIQDSPTNEIDPMFKVIMDDKFSMKSKSDVVAKMAARSFIQKSFSVKKDYIDRLMLYYNSGVENMDFSNSKLAKDQINAWVEESTNKLIKNLIPDGAITPLTRLVLVNTLYFKAPWTSRFIDLNSRKFQTPSGAVEVPYLYQKANFKVFENDNTMHVAIPYSDETTYFVIAMPKNDEALKKFEAKKNIKWYFLNLRKRLKQWKSQKVTLFMPKFTTEQSLDLKKVLRKMGVTEIFSQTADLSGVSDTYLYVSDFLHKARIGINKEGTEAAAASASLMSARSLTKTVFIDRPFLFAVFEDDGDVLFTGKIVNPSI